MLQPLQFAVQSTKDESLPGKDTARLLNMYPETAESGVTLRSAPGLVSAADLGPGKVEALISGSDGLYAAVGGSFKRWSDGVVTTLGNLPQGDTTMARSRSQIAVVAGDRYLVWDGTTFSEVTTTIDGGDEPDYEESQLPFARSGSVSFLSNYFIITQQDGEAFAYSLDADTIDALNFASAEYRPDDLRRVMVSNDLIWFMGEDSIEPWQVTGAANLPFARISGAVKEKGLRATLETVALDNTLFWVSGEGRVYRMGQAAEILSTDAICATLEGSTGRMFAYQQRRHDSAVVRLEDAPAVIYDPSSGMWWERSTNPCHDPWEVTATVRHNGTWYAGTSGGQLCTFGGFEDLGKSMRREVISTNLTQAGERFSVDRLNLRVSGSGSVMISWSNDGGETFSNERQRTFGGMREYPIQINRLGQHRQFCLKIACTDNTEFSIHSASVEVS